MTFSMSLLASLQRYIENCAAKAIRREKPIIIAITGTVGKSATKNAIGVVLDAQDPMRKIRVPRKNYNNELGIPLTIFDISAPGRSLFAWGKLLCRATLYRWGLRHTGADTFVLEMGADQPGDLAHLTSIAPPTIAVVTAVTPDDASIAPVHVANYASIDAVAEEKATLVKALGPEGTAILNADDKRVFAMRHLTTARVFTFGEADGTDVRITGTRVRMQEGEYGRIPIGLEVSFESFNRLRKVFLPGTFSKSSAYAISAAFLVASVLDVSFEAEEIIQRLAKEFRALAGRTRILPGIKHTTLLDGSYNASPAATILSLKDLAGMDLASGQRRVACLGEMRELGPTAKDLHFKVGAEVAQLKLDFLVVCGTLAHAMADGARAYGMSEEKIKIFEDTPEAGLFLQQWIRPGDVIFAKASEGSIHDKGVRMERVIKELMAEPMRAEELLVRQEPAWQRK